MSVGETIAAVFRVAGAALFVWLTMRVISRQQRTTSPDEECIDRGAKFCCQIDREGRQRSGKLWDEHGIVRWRYGIRGNPSGRGWGNPFRKPEFVVARTDGAEETVIHRASFIPPVFHIIDGNQVLGRIRMVSLLRNKYAIDIDGVNSWIFRMPLFTLQFSGNSESSTDIWVVVGPSKTEWNILIRPGVCDRQLVAALAFIHNEWWNYG